MVTAEKAEPKPTKSVPRFWLLNVQVRNVLSKTTKISQDSLQSIDKGLSNQWIETIAVHGLDDNDRCRVGLELRINWVTHGMQVLLTGGEVSLDRTLYTDEDLAHEVVNAVAVFNLAVHALCLRTKWCVRYPKNLDRERINQALGFSPSPPVQWAGKVVKQLSPVPELPELTITMLAAN
jgi:hypothetical protein